MSLIVDGRNSGLRETFKNRRLKVGVSEWVSLLFTFTLTHNYPQKFHETSQPKSPLFSTRLLLIILIKSIFLRISKYDNEIHIKHLSKEKHGITL
jgi:hypothetical protein